MDLGRLTQTYTNPNGTTSQYNPANNYANTGMSYTDYTDKYGNANQMGAAASAAGAAAATAGNNQAHNPAVGLPNSTTPATPAPTYGTASGPGIMQQWFDERANGTDPGWEYATGRGMTSLGNQYAAAGDYDSGAARQGQSDYLANMGSQREAQLDPLASAASGERQNQMDTMFGLGMGLAGGQAGLGAAYDTSAANAMSGANSMGLNLGAQAGMIPYLSNQNLMNQLFGLGSAALSHG